MNRIAPRIGSLVVLAGLALWTVDAVAGPGLSTGPVPEDGTRWLVVQPGYPGSTEDATGFMERFSRYLEQKAELSSVRGTYHNVPEDALAAIRSSRPAFALVSLGFYLEHRRRLGLVPALESEPGVRFIIAAPEGSVESPEALRGGKVAGGPLYERAFLERVVFRESAPVAAWDGEPVLRTSRALRRLQRGTYSAVVLTEREYEAFSSLSPGKKLEKVLVSAYYPQSLLVYFTQQHEEEKEHEEEKDRPGGESRKAEERSRVEAGGAGGLEGTGANELSEEQRLRLGRALLSLEKDGEGKALLKTMGIRRFVEVRSDRLKRMEGTFDAEGTEGTEGTE